MTQAPTLGAGAAVLVLPSSRSPTQRSRHMLAVIRYDVQAEQASRLQEVYPRHRAYLEGFAESGDLLLIGTLEDPIKNGSLAVFRTKDSAERFVQEDPFVLEGLVRPRVLEWDALDFRDQPAATS
jgi:uncharacterized protein YciI